MTNKTLTKEEVIDKRREVCELAPVNDSDPFDFSVPLHLEHLIKAVLIEVDDVGNAPEIIIKMYDYDLSVAENLENLELLKLLGELLNK